MSTFKIAINEQEYSFSQKNYDPISGAYKIPFQAPDTTSYPRTNPDHKYPVTLTMTDDNGDSFTLDYTDSTYGSILQLRVRERNIPLVTIVSPDPEEGVIVVGGGEVSLVYTVTDTGESGLDTDNTTLQFGDNVYHLTDPELSVTVIENGYRIEFTPSVYLSDGDYPVYITAKDNDGNADVVFITVRANEGNLSFIYDRTLADVNRVKYLRDKIQAGTATFAEKFEYSLNMKGARNRNDFVRITTAIKYICDKYEIPYQSSDFDIPELPTLSWINNLLSWEQLLRSSVPIHIDTPYVPTAPINTYQKMNDLEKILFDMWYIIKSRFFYYCDAGLWADGEIGLLE